MQQQQRATQIPIQRAKHDPMLPNLIDFDQSTDRIRPCIVCKHNFHDVYSTGLCQQCDYKKNPSTRHITIRRAPPAYNLQTYPTSDFISSNSMPARIRGPVTTACPHCKNMNLINTVEPNRTYPCLKCGTYLHIP